MIKRMSILIIKDDFNKNIFSNFGVALRTPTLFIKEHDLLVVDVLMKKYSRMKRPIGELDLPKV